MNFIGDIVFPIAILTYIINLSDSQETIFQSVLKYYRDSFRIPRGATDDTDVFNKEYDFIVIGAGSGGSVVANRLTEVPGWSVLLIEAGKEEIFLSDIPLLVSYIVFTDYNWGYKTEPQEGICLSMKDQRCSWHRGKGMGGTSIINYMVYTRGSKVDYDKWAALGNIGWSYDEVLPYFLKSEDIAIPALKSSPYHSSGGYLTVDKARFHTPLGSAFIKAAKLFGYQVNDNSNPNPLGVFKVLSTTRDGSRLSASKAFLRPVRSRPNLHIAKQARVTKILIDALSKETFGVEFVKNRRKYTVRARKEVVVSAGTLNSAQLLMLSGIGPREHLAELDIPVIKDLKVGYNLQDHVSMAGLVFLLNDTVSIVESRYQKPQYLFDYVVNNRGPLTLPGGAEGLLFTRTKYSESLQQPDMELVMGPGSLAGDTGQSLRKLLGLSDEVFNAVYGPRLGQDGFGIVPILLQPKSRGRVKLKSKNPFHWPLFYPNYYTDQEGHDIKTIVEAIKHAVEIGESPAFAQYNSQLLRTPIPGCKHLQFASDEYWACTARHITTNVHHQVGTCKMGPPSDPDAVVDPRLRVYGIKGLRVVDASIMPVIPTGHTNAIVFMIGEKASDMIKEDWGNSAQRRSALW